MKFDIDLLSDKTTKNSPSFKSYMKETKEEWERTTLPTPLGLDQDGNPHIGDLMKFGNIIMAGSTGSGKSVFNHTLICSLILKQDPSQLKLFLADPKRVEFAYYYENIPHLIDKVYEAPKEIITRLSILKEELKNKKDPYSVIIIDTFSDLMAYDSVRFESIIGELSKSGAIIVLCDSRPSNDVFTDNLLKYFPTKMAFKVSNELDSKRVITVPGAEELNGAGDMLFLPKGSVKPIRLQGPYISEEDIQIIVSHVK
ncbi:hypothetical protein A3D03_04490 [Candidatus Gottesmanbacteria bacterium RIFCSPHIGHO2_02_FULL_40_13]|uniref:FtsK domain-containing protein n=1 Tax=Candidatus Gottesmanbacteria bacterium RIFCSPHIGHO2_02_FULL_40_13 TaxID=1798384 RepID=A0A1F6AA23_9BACT|nr:MAG: hypothetical protein A3D03_04490 [Candidatus Gottesmanbacteria bacterium RIFCSPHIGHO2_02_FULL_40_13]